MKIEIKNTSLNSFKFLIISLVVFSCKSESNKYAEIYTKGFTKKIKYYNSDNIKCIGYKLNGFYDSCEIQYDINDKISYIKNYRKGKTLGDALEFYDNGILKCYRFMVRQDTCCIQTEFNRKGKIISKIDADAWNYLNIDFDKYKDSAAVQVIIPKILFNNFKLYVSNTGVKYKNMSSYLGDSKNFTNDYECNFVQQAKNNLNVYLKGECIMQGASKTLWDSVFFVRTKKP